MADLPSIQQQISSKDLFEAFRIQLAKDFAQCNYPVDFIATLEPDYKNIHIQIVRVLQSGEKKSDLNLMQLLYRVDIPEVRLKKLLSESGDTGHLNVIAELIIKRILQKVVIRRYYGGSSG
ncbi:MAG: hypothetical protein U0289_12305 [Cyclobacteriaceae bacterium]|jgi:hypothetical protein|nr:hypothetical protein [Cytophagales bacterium]HNP76055.1 hypothetical protein [Cyclobacteriaceae bacterium]